MNFDVVDGARRAVARSPRSPTEIETAIRIHDERFIDPAAYVHSIADSVRTAWGS